MRPKSEIYTPKRDDEHPYHFHMRSLPPPDMEQSLISFTSQKEGIRKGTKTGKREQVEWKSEMTEWKWRTLSDTIDRRTNIKESARHENEKQQSVEQGNSMTNRGDRRKREETIKFMGEWQMWRVFIRISRSILILKKWMVKLCCGLPCFCWFKKVT